MPRKRTKPLTNIFTYSDFRLYLKDLVKELKTLNKNFTMRYFAQQAGFGSPSFLKMIMDGERTLTNKSVQKFCEILKIKGKEKEYFEALVEFNQTEDPDKKQNLFNKIDKLRPRVTFSKIEQHQNKYLTNDYYAAIREMVLLEDFQEDAKWIAAKCLPRISPGEAREAIETLLELKLLIRDNTGKLIQSDPIVDTGPMASAMEAFSFHEAVLNKARRYLSHLEQEKRNFSALTIPIPSHLEREISQRIDSFQNDILGLVNADDIHYDGVYQLNVQFFPVTLQENKKKDKK
ncbi:MAG: TIGR02147 family protein [bacterium]|nr:TIGR02147 family protein [bacterium]MBU1917611.1 TIGR02147 family protein [bacterium]